MHCADCYSENMRMRGSLSSPGWECADCGSTKPPVHAHDKLPAEPEDEHHVSTEILETCKPTWQGYDPGAGDDGTAWVTGCDITAGSISSHSLAAPMSCDDCEEPTMNGVVQFDGGVTHIWCTNCAWERGVV